MKRSASLSPDGLYRYELRRQWGQGDACLWVMLNPSTADASVDDPTIRRCRSFSQAWGWAGMAVVNLYALRCTRPVHLLHHPDPVGPRNETTLRSWLLEPDVYEVMVAWGSGARRVAEAGMPDMVEFVEQAAQDAGRSLSCLGHTREGDPRHPLYLPASTRLEPWMR